MTKKDVSSRTDIEQIVSAFYAEMLKDPILGFIFTDIARIDLQTHLPVIVDFWSDIVFKGKRYTGNTLRKHTQLNDRIALKSGHFTRWLYLFDKAVRAKHAGPHAELMIARAEMVAKSISAAISERKKSEMNLVLPK